MIDKNWSYETMQEWLLDFADCGYHVMPIRGVYSNGNCMCGMEDCNNQYKHPRMTGWSKAPLPSMDQIEAFISQKIFAQSYGIVLTADDIVVDFDPRNNENAIEELNAMLGFDIETKCNFVIKTGSGGKHFYFKKSKDIKTVKILKEIKGIDFLSAGSFVVGCGSFHKSGFSYEAIQHDKSNIRGIDDAPQALLDLIERPDVVKDSAYEAGSSNLDELREALEAIPNDENTDYDVWINIGMALSYETSNSDNGYALWDEWSDKSQKHDGTAMEKKWASFANTNHTSTPRTAGTIFKLAYDNGWEQTYGNEIDLSAFVRKFEEGRAEKFSMKKQDESKVIEFNDIPTELQKIKGVMGDSVSYMLSTAQYPLYMPSLNASLAMCAVVIGRDFTTDFDNYSSVYTMSVAETGAGKEHSYKIVSKILQAANQGSIIKGEVTGKSAIITELYSEPRALFFKDEMAHWMQIIGSKNVSENKLSEVKAWMELFSKQDSTYSSDSFTSLSEILKNKLTGDEQNSLTINRPSVSLLGMTTPHKLSESMTKMMISDGFLNRFIVMFAQEGDQKMNKNSKSRAVPQEILSWIETIERRVLHHNRGKNSQGRNDYDKPMEPIVLPFTAEAFDRLDSYEDDIMTRKKELRKNGLELMIVRNREKAMRISLTMELSKDPYALSVGLDSVNFSIALVDFCFEQLIEYIEFEMVENSIDKRYRDAYNVIEKMGPEGIMKKDLMKLHPFKSTDSNMRKEIFNYLILESQDIFLIEEGEGKGRKAHRLVAAKFVES